MLLLAALCLGVTDGSLAWTDGTSNPGNTVTGTTLDPASGVGGARTAGAATTCTTIAVSWTAAPAPVNTYVVEARTANGPWTTVNADTGPVTSINDTTTYTQSEVTYRVAAGYADLGIPTAWQSATTQSVGSVQCGTVGEVDDLAATTAPPTSCAATMQWTAPFGATTYDRRYSTNGGSTWTTASNVAGTTWSFTTTIAEGSTVLFQVRPGIGTGNDGQWSNTVQVDDWGCEAQDMAVAQGCANATITWTTNSDATTFDRRYSTNGGATWTTTNNAAGLSWVDAVAHAQGSTVLFQVRPGIGTGSDGKWSDIVQVDDWGFHIVSAEFVNTGAANSVNAGDQVIVTFNQASNGTTPNGTNSTSIYVRVNNAASRGVYLGGATAATNTNSIAKLPFAGNITGTSQAFTGSTAWSAGNTVWTWTRGAGGAVAESAPTWSASSVVGTSAANPARVKCSDGVTNLGASAFTVSGWF